ncbi:hypothetical protein ABV409_09710 [Flagellimonas sp. DF-77]|uniref:hypothetical protein n=1 Tax=Flagellimonas algarum TaxID=3230298 RepID=UPI0033950BA9
MQKSLLFLGCLLVASLSFAQEQGIKITNESVAKEIIIKENKRIRVRTQDREKITGRFTVVDAKTISIKGQNIPLSEIISIKRNPLLLNIFTSSFFVYAGAITIGIGAIIAALSDSSAWLLAIPGSAMIYTGIKSPNFLKNYKTAGDWSFEIIPILE